MSELVSVIILNWNGSDYLRSCIESVLRQDYAKIEIIVVDNGSTDGSPEIVEKDFRSVILIRTGANLGFGGGNNIGIRKAAGKYIVVLNNDAEMERSCVTELKRAIDKDKRYGASASKILLKYEEGLIDAAGIVVYPDGLSMGRGRLEREESFNREEEVFFASGCCAMLRREMLDDIALQGEYYDEDFFAYADDTDLGWRARLRGWRCIYTPAARAFHLHSASTSTYSSLKAFLVERNRIWVAVKCFPVSMIVYGQFFTALRYLYQAYGALTGRGAPGAFAQERSKVELFKVLCRAYRAAVVGLFRVMGKRRKIQRRRVASVADVSRILERYSIAAREIALKG